LPKIRRAVRTLSLHELPMVSSRLTKGLTGEPLWNLYRDGVTQGLIGALNQCPEKARLLAIEGISPIRTSGALSFGSVFHDALDKCYTNCMIHGTLPDIGEVLEEMEEKDRTMINSDPSCISSEVLEQLEENYGIAFHLLNSYFDRWSTDIKKYSWEALEEKFGEVDETGKIIDNCYWIDKQGTPIRVRGKFDGVVRINGKLWLFETKTKSRIEDKAIFDKLRYDLQVNLYLWAIRKKYGEYPVGVIYNLVRRPQLKRGKSSIKDFCDRVAEDINTRSDFYFLRYNAVISPREQDLWSQEMDDMIQRVVDWFEGRFHWRESNACMSPFPCQYLPVCSSGERRWFKKKHYVFPELSNGESEDSD
jgi:hypothetical protein